MPTTEERYISASRFFGKIITSSFKKTDLFTPEGSVKVVFSELDNINPNFPISTDGDSVYSKDIDNDQHTKNGTFEGDILSLFNDYDVEIKDVSDKNPKTFTIQFKRPVETSAIGIGSGTGNFSNVKILLKDLSGAVIYTVNDSANDEKYSNHVYPFPPTVFLTMVVEFHTSDPVRINGMLIAKDIHVVARMQALKPDGTLINIDATAGGNLKMSLEEFDESFNTNPLPVVQTDPTGRKAELDNYFKVPIVIDAPHHEVHEGDTY